MLEFHKMYQSITASPFRRDNSYIEIEPSPALKPYIRCFWGNKKPIKLPKTDAMSPELVVPDTCMDIIFHMNYTDNKIGSHFCGINDSAFEAWGNDKEEVVSTFGIRFYAWTAVLFAKEPMTEVKNNFYDVDWHFTKIKKAMEPLLFEAATMKERIAAAEAVLLQELHEERMSPIVTSAVYEILKQKGRLDVMQLSKEIHISTRQLERLCKYYMGVSPKELTSLIRYQYLWKDIAFHKEFQVMDAVEKYGYTDQSHLLRDFKKYHSMLPKEAKAYAIKSCRIFTI